MDRLTADVVQRACARDTAALTIVYECLAPRVRGFLVARGSEDPDGLTNEVFVQVLSKIESVQGGPSGLRTFVFSVAHARMVDEYRRRSSRPPEVTYDADQDDRSTPAPEQVLVDATLPAHLETALGNLTEDQRDVLIARTVADLTIEETATALGRSAGSVKQLHRRALHRLRDTLGSEPGQGK